jgi:hypothetical protein
VDQASADDSRTDYQNVLASRLFSRAILVLSLDQTVEIPTGERNKGLTDLQSVRRLDDFMAEHGLIVSSSGELFERLIRRIHGLAAVAKYGEVREIWDGRDVVKDACNLLSSLWEHPAAPLFDSVTRRGRCQQLEAALVALDRSHGCTSLAIQRSIRMFVEDDFLLETAFEETASVLVAATSRAEDFGGLSRAEAVFAFHSDIVSMAAKCKNIHLEIGKNVVVVIELNPERRHSQAVLETICSKSQELFDNVCDRGDYFGVLSSNQETRALLRKEADRGEECVSSAARLVSESGPNTVKSEDPSQSTLRKSLQMTSDARFVHRESFLVLVTDGDCWTTEEYLAVRSQIDRRNPSEHGKVHLHVIGIDINNSRMRGECDSLCACTSANSSFVDVRSESALSAAFDRIASVWGRHVSSRRSKSRGRQCMKWMAMESL